MSAVFFNGQEVGKVYTTTHKPRKKDKGHSVVRRDSLVTFTWRVRNTLYCECGRKFSGYNERSMYSHNNHIDKETAS
jgi:hypothetical protein